MVEMKTLHVSNYFRGVHDHVGGAEQACYRTCKMLTDNGHEALVVTSPFDHPEKKTMYEPIRLESVSVYENYLPEAVGRYVEAVKWYALQYDPVARAAFKKILLREKPDVVHFHNFQFLSFSLLREAAALDIPTCLSIYDYWVFCPKAMLLLPNNETCQGGHSADCVQCLPPKFVPIQRALLSLRRKIFESCFNLLDYFIVLSEHSAGVLRNHGIEPNKIRIVPLTLPIEYSEASETPSMDLGDKSILFVGWLNDRKGVHIALEAMPYILEKEPDAVLHVIGGKAKFATEYEERCEKIIIEHNLRDKVRFLGHQPPETVRRYLEGTSVLILPEQYENMSPLIMVEAMMLGKPVVASDIGGIPEYIEDGVNGCLADPYDARSFAEKIVMLLARDALRVSVGEEAKKRILRRNSNEAVWLKTKEVYENAVEKK